MLKIAIKAKSSYHTETGFPELNILEYLFKEYNL